MSASQATPSQNAAVDLSRLLQLAVETAGPSVLRLGTRRGHATSATIWSPGVLVTSHRATRRSPSPVARDADEQVHELELVGRDPSTDIAVFRAPSAASLPAITRAAPDELPGIGALALALARPGWRIRASLRAIGIVGPSFRTQLGGRIDAWLETDRTLPHGFSGGPLIDPLGRMIGLDTRGLVRHADLAIPVATLERVVEELLTHGGVARGWLGLSLVRVDLPEGQRGSADSPKGVMVAGLEAGGPAAAAGVLIGDVIVAADGEPIANPGDLREALHGKAGSSVELALIRAGATKALKVEAGSPPA